VGTVIEPHMTPVATTIDEAFDGEAPPDTETAS
jgi:hypothetical protein